MPLSREQFDALRAKGLSVEQIARFESGERGDTLAPRTATSTPPTPKRVGMAPVASHPLFAAAQGGADLSQLLAMPGGFVRGPIGALASGIGGGGGEIIDQAAQGRFDPAGIGMEAAKQAALGFAGMGVGKAGGYAARQMMQGALRPLIGLTRVAPNVAQDALESGATVGRVPGFAGVADALPVGAAKRAATRVAGGFPHAKSLRRQRATETAGLLENATNAAAPLPGGAAARIRFRMSALLPNADDVVSRASPHYGEELDEARQIIKSIAKNYKGAKTPQELKAIKSELQARARSAYEAVAQQGKKFSPDAPDLPVNSRIYWQAASRVQKALEGIPESAAGGSIGAAEKATQKAINVANAVKRAGDVSASGVPQWIPQTVGRGGAAATGGAIGALTGNTPEERVRQSAIGMAAGSALTHPAVLSRLAYLLYNPATMGGLRNAPRGIDALFNDGSMPPDTLRNR